VKVTSGDLVRLEKAGGGGLGEPRERAFDAIVDDVIDGYVSSEAAIAEYGVDPQRLAAAVARWTGEVRTPASAGV
jgi:N-methylhydantoinase B/oxoprolinase/acetone carboxylase alpha subunit